MGSERIGRPIYGCVVPKAHWMGYGLTCPSSRRRDVASGWPGAVARPKTVEFSPR